jgi:tetratricopeptide (TPR) repeat protein
LTTERAAEELLESASALSRRANAESPHNLELAGEAADLAFEAALKAQREFDEQRLLNVLVVGGQLCRNARSPLGLERAFQLFLLAVGITEKGDDRELHGRLLGDLGLVACELGKHTDAIELLSRAATINGIESSPFWAGGLMSSLMNLGRYQEALEVGMSRLARVEGQFAEVQARIRVADCLLALNREDDAILQAEAIEAFARRNNKRMSPELASNVADLRRRARR